MLLASIIESKFPLIILTQFVPVFGLFQPLKLKCACTGTLGPQPWHIERIFSQVASLINHIINKGTLSHLSRPNTKAFSETEMCPTLMPYRIVGNFWGRKLSRILQFCGCLRKFSPWNLGAWYPLVAPVGNLRKFYPRKSFSTNSWKFSPTKVSRYTVPYPQKQLTGQSTICSQALPT